jgi:hypothetical protein
MGEDESDEITAIYQAGAAGKCGTRPSIIAQPQSQFASVGENALLSATAVGAAPLSYQWRFNGADVAGATDSTLALNSVQVANAGHYVVVASNPYGTATSTVATLAVSANLAGCVSPQSGLVAWWPGEGSALDVVGGNNGTLQNGAGYAAGMVGQAFLLNGVNQYIAIPDNPSLRPRSVTLEGWFNFTATDGLRQLMGKTYGSGWMDSYAVWYNSGTLCGGVAGTSEMPALSYSWTPIPGSWHHLAYTFDDDTKAHVLYLDGTAVSAGQANVSIAYDAHPMIIGADTENESRAFFFPGLIDEVALYSRVLSADEVLDI